MSSPVGATGTAGLSNTDDKEDPMMMDVQPPLPASIDPFQVFSARKIQSHVSATADWKWSQSALRLLSAASALWVMANLPPPSTTPAAEEDPMETTIPTPHAAQVASSAKRPSSVNKADLPLRPTKKAKLGSDQAMAEELAVAAEEAPEDDMPPAIDDIVPDEEDYD